MFRPEEVIFAPTGECGLACPHCKVARDRGELSIADALAFLDACAAGGIERVGFSGGEPFLRSEFVAELCRAAVDRGMLFDRLMTSGDWWADEAELLETLASVRDAGFDGVIGLSWDAYHGQKLSRMTYFARAVFEAWGRRDVLEILAVRSPDDSDLFADFSKAALELGCSLETAFGEPSRLVDRAFERRSEEDPDDGSLLSVPITLSLKSEAGTDARWEDDAWFVDDYCAGPGNVFYVHPDGSVAPCCGFANERPELTIGTVKDGFDALMERAGANLMVRAAFDEGLGRVRSRLEASGRRFPGKTRDICAFCERLCASVPESELRAALRG